jgi:uncharacterized peroxidase-related enzyme
MSRIPLARPTAATGDLAASFGAVRARIGAVPNGFKVLGISPTTLRGYLGFSDALAAGSLTAAERERIAVLTAEVNECGYCLAGHLLAGRAAGLSEAELAASRLGEATDTRAAALLRFAGAVLGHGGDVPDAVLDAARAAGLTDAELIEVVAEVALSTLTNYANRFAQPDLDFPPVTPPPGRSPSPARSDA